MGVSINSKEFLRVHNANDVTKNILYELSKYLDQFKDIPDIQGAEIYRMRLKADGQEIAPQQIDLCSADTVDFFIEYSLLTSDGEKYGLSRWESYLRENDCDELRKNVTYKCIEYYDNTTELRTYLYSDKYAGCPPFDQERGEIEGLGWYSYHFQLAITFDNEKIFGDKELAERLTDLGNEFNGKYDICDNLEEPDSGEFFIDGALRLMSDQLDDFAQDVQKIHDFATEHGLRTDITAEFTEDGSSEQEVFAAIRLSSDGGRYKWEYCKF